MKKKLKTFLLGCLILVFGCMPISDVSAATTQDTSNLNASYETKIDRFATGIVLNKTVDSLVVGQVDTLKALVTPRDTTNKSIKWTSSDPSIATVDNNGKVTALKVGTTTIIATVDDGRNLHAPCTVHITNLLTKKKKVDIVFTTGSDNTLDTNSFNTKVNSYVKNALVNSGIDTNIQTIETSEQNLQNSFTWHQDVSSSVGQISFQNNGSQIQMYGNPSNPGFNKIYTTNADTGISKQELNFSYNIDFGDSFNGAGILIGTDVNSNGLMNGYALFIHHFKPNGIATLYEITNWSSSTSQNMETSPNARAIGSVTMGISGTCKLTTTKNKLILQKDGNEIGNIALPRHYGWGFGFFSDHYSHGCNLIGHFSLDNLQLKTTKGKSFSDILKDPTWRYNTHKFVANLSEDALKSITTNSPDYPPTLATMLSNKEYFLGIMNKTDKPDVDKFINENDGHGTYIDNSDLDKALSSVTQYVLSSINEEENNSNIFLIGDEINYSNYNSNDADVLWSYSQDNKHLNYNNEFENCSKTGDIPLDNDLGISDFATGEWVHNKVSQFNKPGKYTISYKDKNGQLTTEVINIHRKPTPIFTAYAVSNTSTGKFDITIKDEDKSYDIDHENSDGTRRGIVNSKFQWKEITDGTTDTWHDGKLPSGQAANKDFLVKLEVQDLEGQWSDPLVKYISTRNQNLAPIAQFTESTGEMPVDQLKSNTSAGNDVVFTDESYDANGDSIREHWIVTDSNGNKIYDGSAMPTASVFIGKPLGTYNITLTCDDGPSPKFGTVLTSDPYTLQLKLVPINHKPTAHFKVDNTSKNPQLIKITEDSTDVDGDSISTKAWTVTDSKGTIVEQTEDKLPNLNSLNGTYTITLKVRDNPKIQPELWSDPYSQTVVVENSNFKSK